MSGQRLLLALVAVLVLGAILLVLMTSGSGEGDVELPDVRDAGSADLQSAPGAGVGAMPGQSETVRTGARGGSAGMVVDTEGRPVAGAQIWFGEEGGGPTVSSDGSGQFPVPQWVGRSRQNLLLSVYAENYLPYEREVTPSGSWHVVLQPGGVLNVQLVGANGESLSVATTLELRCGNARREVKTNGRGFVRTGGWGLQPVAVAWNDTPLGISEKLKSEEPVTMLVRLPRYQEGAIHGVVRANGRPLAGATVHRHRDRLETDPVTTDAEGRFEMPFLDSRSAVIVAEAEGLAPAARHIKQEHLDGLDMVFELQPGRIVPGRVISTVGERPVPGAEVEITLRIPFVDEPRDERGQVPEHVWPKSVTTDEGGLFSSGALPPTRTAFRAGLADKKSRREFRTPDDATEVVLWLDLGVTVTGQVTDPGGRPITTAILCLRRKYKQHRVGYNRNKWPVDEEGRFTITVPPKFGTSFFVAASAPGCLPNGMPVQDAVPGAPVQLTMILNPGSAGKITGRVLDFEGNPVHKVRVRARPTGSGDLWGTRTDPFGRFRFRSLPRGSYELFVDDPPEGLEKEKITVSTDVTGLELQLAGPRLLEGRLVPPQGWEGDLIEASGMVLWDDQDRFLWIADPEGRFRFDAPPEGTRYRLLISPRDLAPVLAGPFMAPAEADEEVVIRLEFGQRVTGEAIMPEGSRIQTGTLRVYTNFGMPGADLGGRAWDLPVELDGERGFVLPHVPGEAQVTLNLRAVDTEGKRLEGSQTFTAQTDRYVAVEMAVVTNQWEDRGIPLDGGEDLFLDELGYFGDDGGGH